MGLAWVIVTFLILGTDNVVVEFVCSFHSFVLLFYYDDNDNDCWLSYLH